MNLSIELVKQHQFMCRCELWHVFSLWANSFKAILFLTTWEEWDIFEEMKDTWRMKAVGIQLFVLFDCFVNHVGRG